MSDFVIVSSTGALLPPTQVLSGQNGSDVSEGYVSRPVPGQLLLARGKGQYSINHIGVRGSLTAEVIVGATGTARAIMKVTSAVTGALDTVQLSLDTSNRPVLTISYGGTITATTASGSALAVGSKVSVRAVWDSVTPLASGNHVDWKALDGSTVPGTMGSIPAVPYVTTFMGYVLVGFGTSLGDFNGTILNLQVGDQRI